MAVMWLATACFGITFLHLGDCLQPLAAARQALAVHCRVSSFTVSVLVVSVGSRKLNGGDGLQQLVWRSRHPTHHS